MDDERNERFCLCAASIKRSREPKKRRIVLPESSMSVASAEGSLWDTAVAILMLRHCIEAVNTELPRDQKIRSTQRTKRPRDLLGNHQKKQPPKNMWVWAREGSGTTGRSSNHCALRTSPGREDGGPEAKTKFFAVGCARRACGVAAAGRWHGGDS